MKQFFVIILLCNIVYTSFSKIIEGGAYYSTTKEITFDLDHSDYMRDWYISTEDDPNVLYLYCENPIELTFHLPSQDLNFLVSNLDTIRLVFIINDKDSINTLIIGVHDIPNNISEDEKLFHLSRLWSEVKYNFVNIDQIDFDWDSLYKAYIPLVKNTSNDYDFYRILQRFYATLHDGHTEVYMPYSLTAYEDYVPVAIDYFDKQLYITSTIAQDYDSSFLAAKILMINNIPIHQYLQDSISPYISASTEQSLWTRIPQAICYGLRCKPLVFEIQKQNGEKASMNLVRNGEATRRENIQHCRLREKTSEPWDFVQLFWHQDSILQLSINSFYPDEYVISLIAKKENEIQKAKGLIIDLRQNGGGSTVVAHYLQSHLTQAPYFINFAWQSRINDGVRKANGNWIKEYKDYYLEKAYRTEAGDTIAIADSIQRWSMPTVVLFGEYTFSAAEDFLVNLYETPNRPLFIGKESGGSTGSPLVINDLPLDGYARLCTRRILFPYSQTAFVGKGVQPDIEISTSFNNFLTGEDVTLQKTIELFH